MRFFVLVLIVSIISINFYILPISAQNCDKIHTSIDSFNGILDTSWVPSFGEHWHHDQSSYHSQPYSLKSGELKCPGISSVTRFIRGPGNVNFWWNKGRDLNSLTELYLLVDGNVQRTYESTTWEFQQYDLTSGAHNLTWVLELKKYGNIECYPISTCAWIDDVEITETQCNDPPAGSSVEITPPGDNLRSAINNPSINEILLKAGVYEGEFNIKKINNKIIKPEPGDMGSVVLDAEGENYNLAIEDASNIVVEDLIIKNGKSGILIENVADCKIINNIIYGFELDGINLRNVKSPNSIIDNNIESTIEGSYGINLFNSIYTTIEGNTINAGVDIILGQSCGNKIYFFNDDFGGIIEDNISCGVCNGERVCDGGISFKEFQETRSCNEWP